MIKQDAQDLLLLKDKDFAKVLHDRFSKGGVYKIIAVRNRQRIPIHRFL